MHCTSRLLVSRLHWRRSAVGRRRGHCRLRGRLRRKAAGSAPSSAPDAPVALALGLGLLLDLDLRDDGFDLGEREVADLAEALDDGEVDVLGAGLDDLEQAADRQLDRRRRVLVRLPVLLEELADRLGRMPDRVRLPRRVDARGLRQIETRRRVVLVEADDETRDAERADTAGLGIALLDAGDVSGDVLDRDRVLDRQAMRLALDPCAVDEDARVGGQP